MQAVKPTLGYRAGVLLGALVSVLLPLVYVGLMAAVAYGMYYHVTEFFPNKETLSEFRRVKVIILLVVLNVLPLVVGSILLLMMIKPLLARHPTAPARRTLRRSEAPLFFNYVEHICQAVEAPRPDRIDIDCEVNASASFRHPLLGMIDNKLVLTVGLPLVAGLNARQLAGVIAHEFGHFSQGAGMRFTQVTWKVNAWFARAVHERDVWDEFLVNMSHDMDIRLGWFFYVARFFVWVTRKILHGLLWVSHVINCHLLRQMEYDADIYGARVVGSDTYAQTMRQIKALAVAGQWALDDLDEMGQRGMLGDNLPWLILHNFKQMDDDVRARINRPFEEGDTGLFDTHPSAHDRIARIKSARYTGVFDLEVPATALFGDFEAIGRQTTLAFYKRVLGRVPPKEHLRRLQDVVDARRKMVDDRAQLDVVWNGAFDPLLRALPWSQQLPAAPFQAQILAQPGHPSAQAAAGELLGMINALCQEVNDKAPAYRQALRRWDKLTDVAVELAQAQALAQAGEAIDGELFVWPLTLEEHRQRTQAGLHHARSALVPVLDDFEHTLLERHLASLSLMTLVPLPDGLLPHQEQSPQEALQHLLGAAAELKTSAAAIAELRMSLAALRILQTTGPAAEVEPDSPFAGMALPAIARGGQAGALLMGHSKSLKAQLQGLKLRFLAMTDALEQEPLMLFEELPLASETNALTQRTTDIINVYIKLHIALAVRLSCWVTAVDAALQSIADGQRPPQGADTHQRHGGRASAGHKPQGGGLMSL